MTTTPEAQREHQLKTDPEVFEAVWTGVKTHEIRKNDRDFRVGDSLFLRETAYTGESMRCWNPLVYTGRELRRTVSHIQTGYGLNDRWCILSFAQPPAPPVPAQPTRSVPEVPAAPPDALQHEAVPSAMDACGHSPGQDEFEGPYLCIAPVCGDSCSGCARAISPKQQIEYALAYAAQLGQQGREQAAVAAGSDVETEDEWATRMEADLADGPDQAAGSDVTKKSDSAARKGGES